MASVENFFEKNPGILAIEPKGNGFNVIAIGPPILDQYNRHFDDHQSAFAYAVSCAEEHGLMVGLQFKKRGAT